MSPITIGLIGFIVLFVLIALKLPIGFSMALVGFAGFWYLVSPSAAFAKMAITPLETIMSYDLAVLPLFLLMAQIVFISGTGKDLYNLAAKWLGHQPGGLAMATVGASAGFAAVSASSVATASTIGMVSLPEMKRYKYQPRLSTGCIAAGGTIGILIPPSAILIIYGIVTETSINKLFIAGLVPGILEALFYMITIYFLCTLNPAMGPRGPIYTLKEKVASFANGGEIVALVALVLGGLIIGWFTPTEAGAVGAFGAIVFSSFRKRLSWSRFKHAVLETMKTAGMIYCILIGAFIFSYFLAVSNIPFWLAGVISELPVPPLAIMGCVIIVYIFLGCIMDALAMILLTVPVFFPMAVSIGFDPLWFGIIIVRVVEIGLITPPIGINVYVIAGVAPDVPMPTIFKGVLPFLLADVIHVFLLLLVPTVVLFLPRLIG